MGPDKWPFCGLYTEDCKHPFIKCSFVVVVWTEVSILFGVSFPCDFESILDFFYSWSLHAKAYRAVPLYVLWGIWSARNKLIFEDKQPLVHLLALNIGTYYQ